MQMRAIGVIVLAVVAPLASTGPTSLLHHDTPIAQPARPTAEDFTVYFALDSWRITDEGRQVIGQAAKRISELGATHVRVIGHADQTGSPEHNLLLSRRRTQAVLRALQKAGVSAAILQADWKGEFEPAVPGADNGPEAKNRRVTIVIVS
jgi:outer membrane protein OmpA-like peptidoglycan-associated protein